MNPTFKNNIKTLADKFSHSVIYHKKKLILKGNNNEIQIWINDKYGINISVNSETSIKIFEEDFYDIILFLLEMKKNKPIEQKEGFLITTTEWTKEEGYDFVHHQVNKLKKDLIADDIERRYLGGNRFLAEYFKGIIILKDDLNWAKSNVISI